MGIPVIDYAQLEPAARERIAHLVAGQTTLDRVLAWGISFDPPLRIDRMLAQDEYTHDVIVPFEGRFLAYDAT